MALVDWEFWRTVIVVLCVADILVMSVLLIANAFWIAIDIIGFWIIDRRERRGKR